MDINGLAHVQLSVADFEACRAFYDPVRDPDGIRLEANFVPGRGHLPS